MNAQEFSASRTVIDKFALAFHRNNQWADVDDLKGQAWEAALRAYPAWNNEKGYAWTTFLYQKLHWLGTDLIQDRQKELSISDFKINVMSTDYIYTTMRHSIPVDEVARTMAAKLERRISQDEKDVLHLMLFPTSAFMEFVRESKSSSTSTVMLGHYATFLGKSHSKVSKIHDKLERMIRRAAAESAAE
jgi:hypothetical protein